MPVGPHDGPRPEDEPRPEGPLPGDGDDVGTGDGDDVGTGHGTPPDRDEPPIPDPVAGEGVDVDSEWQQIVARLGDLERAEQGTEDGDEPILPSSRRVVRPASTGDPRGWAPDPAVEEAEDHFVPPDPGPVLSGDPLLTMAWCAVLGVPALVVLSVVVSARLPSIVLQVGAAIFLAGLGVLLWRMPRGGAADDVDRGPGAVV